MLENLAFRPNGYSILGPPLQDTPTPVPNRALEAKWRGAFCLKSLGAVDR